MANFKHVEILSQGAAGWNQWREQNPDIKPNLSGTNLFRVDLTHANLRRTDLRKADLRESQLIESNLFKADLRSANLRGANMVASDLRGANASGAHLILADLGKTDLQGADLRGTRLDRANLFEANLKETNLGDAYLPGARLLSANLMHANMRGCNLQDAVLEIANLTGADLSLADVTGAKLYGTERDHWKIDGIRCNYAFWDESGSHRTPADRNFKPGEFEVLYCKSPILEYLFDEGFAPLQILLMDRVVKAINHRLPEFELHLDRVILKGVPRAVFSVLHREDRPKALELINQHYREQVAQIETQKIQKSILNWSRQVPM
jgi:uncharacterized protein YjbI with pentapeptide repeats